MTTTLAIDGNNLLVRAIRATEALDLESDGVPTASTVAFINSLSKYVRQIKPTHLVICWDGGHDGRTLASPSYKESRGIKSRDYTPFLLAKEFLSVSGIYHIEIPGVEADDLIAMYWRQRDPNEKFVILSADKDFLQLLDENVIQLKPTPVHTKQGDIWDAARVREAHRVPASLLPAIMALSGDSSDDIPGVPGIGWKRAANLLEEYGRDFAALLASGDKRLRNREELVKLNYRLINLREDEGMCDIILPSIPEFRPTDRTSILHKMLVDYLKRLMLARIEDSYLSGRLWDDPQSELDLKP